MESTGGGAQYNINTQTQTARGGSVWRRAHNPEASYYRNTCGFISLDRPHLTHKVSHLYSTSSCSPPHTHTHPGYSSLQHAFLLPLITKCSALFLQQLVKLSRSIVDPLLRADRSFVWGEKINYTVYRIKARGGAKCIWEKRGDIKCGRLGWKTTGARLDLCSRGGQWLLCGIRLAKETVN